MHLIKRWLLFPTHGDNEKIIVEYEFSFQFFVQSYKSKPRHKTLSNRQQKFIQIQYDKSGSFVVGIFLRSSLKQFFFNSNKSFRLVSLSTQHQKNQ